MKTCCIRNTKTKTKTDNKLGEMKLELIEFRKETGMKVALLIKGKYMAIQ